METIYLSPKNAYIQQDVEALAALRDKYLEKAFEDEGEMWWDIASVLSVTLLDVIGILRSQGMEPEGPK